MQLCGVFAAVKLEPDEPISFDPCTVLDWQCKKRNGWGLGSLHPEKPESPTSEYEECRSSSWGKCWRVQHCFQLKVVSSFIGASVAVVLVGFSSRGITLFLLSFRSPVKQTTWVIWWYFIISQFSALYHKMLLWMKEGWHEADKVYSCHFQMSFAAVYVPVLFLLFILSLFPNHHHLRCIFFSYFN